MSHCYRSYGAYSLSVFRLCSRDFNQTAQNWSCGSSAKASSFQSSPNRWTTVRPHIGKTKLQSFKTALTKRDKGRLRFSCFFWNTFWICHWPHSRLENSFFDSCAKCATLARGQFSSISNTPRIRQRLCHWTSKEQTDTAPIHNPRHFWLSLERSAVQVKQRWWHGCPLSGTYPSHIVVCCMIRPHKTKYWITGQSSFSSNWV